MKSSIVIILLACLVVVQISCVQASWGGSGDKVKLKDIEVLTLRHGQWTKGRRSAAVPQLNCVGGTAGCVSFVPQVVQCYNRGSDGVDVQWECKTDMDNALRFGKVDVTCEGYDYPDDPYVLKGSCGLEYTLDLTKEGMAQNQQQKQHDYYGGGGGNAGSGSYGWNIPPHQKPMMSNTVTNIACGVILVIIVFAIYKTCIAPPANRQYSRTNDDYPGGGGGNRPPPPGFNTSFYPNTGTSDSFGDSCNAGAGATRQGPAAGGFWTGAATGGLLGYLFGARNNNSQPRPSTSFGGGWGGGSTGYSSGSGFSGSSSSTGTRTASGFGGTRRR